MARLVVAVGGSIAAWKACDVVSKCVQAGHTVDVVLTREARWFVQPLAFGGMTHRRVLTDDVWGAEGGPADHLAATEKADLMVVAPCTANLIGKFAHGIGDEIVSTTFLGCAAPVLLAPAMNTRMWEKPRVQANLEILRGDGIHVVGPEAGWLAEGEKGLGRMTEPAGILAAIEGLLPQADAP